MSNAYSTLVESLLPVAYYRLNEASGTTATDTSPNGYNGTYSASGVTYAQTGAIIGDGTTSVLLNGSTGYIFGPNSLATNGWTAVSVVCWVKFSNITYVTTPRLVSNGDAATSNQGIDLYAAASGGGFSAYIGNGTTNAGVAYSTTLNTTTWYQVVVTWDGATITLYVNGAAHGTASLSGSVSSANALYMGRDSVSSSQFFPGDMDEVAVFNYALTSTQVSNLYNTALADNGTTLAYVVNGQTVQANDIDQAVLTLQQTSGGQDAGHYYLAGAGYTNGAMVMDYVPSRTRGTTPVSVSVDTSDNSGAGFTAATPSTNFLKSYGFQVYDNTNGAQSNAQCGGKYTIQY